MGDTKPWRLWVDGEERTADCSDLDIRLPALVHDVPRNDGWPPQRVLGPRGCTVTLTSPTDRLAALVDGGQQVHQLRVAFGENVLPVPVQFHEEWTDSGVRKMFGSLASNRGHDLKWLTEPQLAEA